MVSLLQNGGPQVSNDEVEQYEESSDEEEDEGGNSVIRKVTAGRNAVVVTLKDHMSGKYENTCRS